MPGIKIICKIIFLQGFMITVFICSDYFIVNTNTPYILDRSSSSAFDTSGIVYIVILFQNILKHYFMFPVVSKIVDIVYLVFGSF